MSDTTSLSHCSDCGQEYLPVLACGCPQVTDARLAHSPLQGWVEATDVYWETLEVDTMKRVEVDAEPRQAD